MADYIIPQDVDSLPVNSNSLLWIQFSASDFISQSGYARSNGGKSSIRVGNNSRNSWRFLAPKEISENVGHDWGEYESIGSRIAGKFGELKKGAEEGKAVIAGASKMTSMEGKSTTDKAKMLANQIAGATAAAAVPKYKIDTSMVYQGSKRREYQFTFFISMTRRSESTFKDVFEPIRKLEELSCASIVDNTLIDIEFPSIFRITSYPGSIIKINHGVLTSVIPVWRAPYIDGYPTSCELQITALDIEPLYRRSFSQGGIIRTS